MNVRFVLDESSWDGATVTEPAGALADAIGQLLDRLDVARNRGEGVVKHPDYYRTDLGDGVQLYSVLFERDCPVHVDHDLKQRLYVALDRTENFNDSQLTQYDAVIDGTVRFAPGVAWAHTSCLDGVQVAVFHLPLGEAPVGKIPVTVGNDTLEIFFVATETEHVDFFRSIITLENADRATFESVAQSAFPALEWADNVWRGLRDFSRPYIEVREELVLLLGGLNDHGAACFNEFRTGDPRQLAGVLSARVGAEVSDEDGATRQFAPARRDRTRRHRSIDKVFWWHVKLRPHVDRIHFLYEQPSEGLAGSSEGRIVVGLFRDHCVLVHR